MSLLPICGKILERLMFNEMFEFFIENKLISSSQSGFKPGNSCINQLLPITLSVESTSHFLLHCPIFHDKRHALLRTLNNIYCKVLESTDSYLTQTLLFGCTSFDSGTNMLVLNATIDYILSTERFEEALS